MTNQRQVYINKCSRYDTHSIISALPSDLFMQIKPGNSVIIKPNWVMESQKNYPDRWEHIITHPTIITAVLHIVIERLSGNGRISILDGPMTEACFEKLINRYPVDLWQHLASQNGVTLEIVDLRDHVWVTKNDIITERKSLPGDPRGKVQVDLLDEHSEFWNHKKSKRGYYGADYDLIETNSAHDGHHNLYSVSRTVIDADIFINIPKLKTHRKAGITCCLKNLVGINTHKNFLPHHSEGGPLEGGDQFHDNSINTLLEGHIVAVIRQYLYKYPLVANLLSPLNSVAKLIFGNSNKVVRNGSWHGNDTIWRMILDLNKILMYVNTDGSMRSDAIINTKHYIGIVDAIIAGEGEGPLSPNPFEMGYVVCGTNPVAIDATCAISMGYDPIKIPTIARAFKIQQYPLCDFTYNEIEVLCDGYSQSLNNIAKDWIVPFVPQHGWKGHIEKNKIIPD